MGLLLMGCFPGGLKMFKRENGPLRNSGERPIKGGKRPIQEGKRPSRLLGCFGHPCRGGNGPSKKPIKRSL